MRRAAVIAAALATSTPAWAASDVFVCSSAWVVETADIYFKTVPGCIEVSSVAFGAVADVTTAPGLPPSELGPLVVQVAAGSNTAAWFAAAATGTPLPDLVVYSRRTTGISGTASQFEHRLTLTAPVVSEVRMSSVGGDVPMVVLSIRAAELEWSFWTLDVDGFQVQPPSTIHWTWPG